MSEVLIYAAIATIVCIMLYSVLGKNVGHGSDEGLDPKKFMEKPKDAKPKALSLKDDQIAKLDPTGLGAIAAKDPSFSPADFLNGAKAAYSMVLEAYASGDREQLGELLTDEVYAIYDSAITDREAKNYKQVTDLGRLRKTSIAGVELEGTTARIQVKYEAELTSALFDEAGNVVEGDTDILSSVSEIWEYVRDVKGSDPAWHLAAVFPSEGDALEADPTPDTKPKAKKTKAPKSKAKTPKSKNTKPKK